MPTTPAPTSPAPPRVALLTGATGGLGPAIAARLADAGMHLALTARSAPELQQLVLDLTARGAPATAMAADLRDPDRVAALVGRVEDEVGPLDVVVHNAATEVCAAFELTTVAELDEIVRVNLTAPLELTRHALPRMLDRGRGHVVFVSSLSGFAGTAFEAPYAATKGAILALGRSLRAEYAGSPVGFSVVAPGSVAGRGMFARAQLTGVTVPRALRLTSPDAVARAVVDAIRTDAPETIVYPGPIRPSLALGLLSPRAAERLNRRLGLAQLFRPAAAARGRTTDSVPTADPAQAGGVSG